MTITASERRAIGDFLLVDSTSGPSPLAPLRTTRRRRVRFPSRGRFFIRVRLELDEDGLGSRRLIARRSKRHGTDTWHGGVRPQQPLAHQETVGRDAWPRVIVKAPPIPSFIVDAVPAPTSAPDSRARFATNPSQSLRVLSRECSSEACIISNARASLPIMAIRSAATLQGVHVAGSSLGPVRRRSVNASERWYLHVTWRQWRATPTECMPFFPPRVIDDRSGLGSPRYGDARQSNLKPASGSPISSG